MALIGHYLLWRHCWWQWRGAQFHASCTGTADRNYFQNKSHSNMADQCYRIHSAFHHEPQLTGLDHQFFRSSRRQWAVHGDQSDFRHSAVFPVEPVNDAVCLGVR